MTTIEKARLAAIRDRRPSPGRYVELEAMRGAACLLVLANHFYEKTPGAPRFAVLDRLVNLGTEAVIFFFVLSGVVITASNPRSIKRYAAARALRVLPIYMIALGLTLLAMFAAGVTVSARDIVGNMLFLQTLQGFIVPPLPFNMAAWSLSYEVTYYILFAAFIVWPKAIIPVFAASVVLGLSAYVFPLEHGFISHWRHMGAFCALWLLGVMAAKAAAAGWAISRRDAAGLFLTGCCLSRAQLSADYYDFIRLFCFAVGSAALCLYFLSSRDNIQPRDCSRDIVVSIPLKIGIALSAAMVIWTLSPSSFSTKCVITLVLAASVLCVDAVSASVRALYSWTAPLLMYIAGLSYAVYIIHTPILYYFNMQFIELNPMMRLALIGVSAVGLAHVLDYNLQPRIKAYFQGTPRLKI